MLGKISSVLKGGQNQTAAPLDYSQFRNRDAYLVKFKSKPITYSTARSILPRDLPAIHWDYYIKLYLKEFSGWAISIEEINGESKILEKRIEIKIPYRYLYEDSQAYRRQKDIEVITMRPRVFPSEAEAVNFYIKEVMGIDLEIPANSLPDFPSLENGRDLNLREYVRAATQLYSFDLRLKMKSR